MAKALTKSQIAAEIAGKHGLTKKAAAEIIQSIVELAYKQAKNTLVALTVQDGNLFRPMAAIYKKNKVLSPAMHHFLEMLQTDI